MKNLLERFDRSFEQAEKIINKVEEQSIELI